MEKLRLSPKMERTPKDKRTKMEINHIPIYPYFGTYPYQACHELGLERRITWEKS
jgi:hypothetical protein